MPEKQTKNDENIATRIKLKSILFEMALADWKLSSLKLKLTKRNFWDAHEEVRKKFIFYNLALFV